MHVMFESVYVNFQDIQQEADHVLLFLKACKICLNILFKAFGKNVS